MGLVGPRNVVFRGGGWRRMHRVLGGFGFLRSGGCAVAFRVQPVTFCTNSLNSLFLIV
ncbi:hypothetical protein Lalb_Chr04g0253041 [Lupinus albus]|uniref:Uncharacterized protein n=1 Tax=Lupinus albus TaxID=3870 RepID=A0A6A4QNZ5_LUPAL|nr:hypothetical protein Lalb_Chr04g0253041 [Lupinus albus]